MTDVATDLAVQATDSASAEGESKEPSPADRPEREYALVALSHIRLHPLNLRKELRDIDELADSIRQNGLLQPLVLVPDPESDDDGTYLLVAGHRRHAGCVKAKHDPAEAIIRRDLEAAGDQVLAMLTENGPRDDLSAIEEAHGYQLALELNQLTPAKLARRLGKPKARITSRISLTRLPEQVQERVHTRQLSLADAEAMVEFAGDTRMIESLLPLAGTRDFGYRIAQEHRRREHEAKVKELHRQLQAAGAHLIDPPLNFPWNSTAKPVSHCVDPTAEHGPDGKPVPFTPEAHAAACALHAVFINSNVEPIYVCRNPVEAGHESVFRQPRATTSGAATATSDTAGDGDPAAAEAERIRQEVERQRQAEEEQRRLAEAQAAEVARREALELAARLRRDFVTTLVRRSGKAHLQAVLRLMLAENFEAWQEDVEVEDARLLAELIDAKLPDLTDDRDDLWDDIVASLRAAFDTRRSPDAIAGALLAIVTHDRERALVKGYGWRVPSCRRYMGFLIAQGYEPTDHERELLEADE